MYNPREPNISRQKKTPLSQMIILRLEQGASHQLKKRSKSQPLTKNIINTKLINTLTKKIIQRKIKIPEKGLKFTPITRANQTNLGYDI